MSCRSLCPPKYGQPRARLNENLTHRVKAWWAGIPAKTHSTFPLPTAVEFMLLLLSRQRRNDVLNDVMDLVSRLGQG